MKKVHIWLFIISLFTSLCCTSAQELVQEVKEALKEEVVDTINKREKKPYTIRFGMDLSKPLMAQLNKDYFGLELVGDIRLFSEFYGAIELGNERKTLQSERINFKTSGTYLKLGFDYNMYKNWKGMNNAIYLGLRIGNSFHKQKVNEYEPYQINHYWATEIIKNGAEIREQESLSARWVEVVTGIKVKMINNIYMGFSLRLNRLMSDTRPENFDNLYIPGFNKKTDENVWGAGFNYTLTYAIPVRL
ncbi:MAG: DUF6048 family protein [Bacteroidota bacterium]|nr:DUF6048 family protein [Bacteroidota bacterium]